MSRVFGYISHEDRREKKEHLCHLPGNRSGLYNLTICVLKKVSPQHKDGTEHLERALLLPPSKEMIFLSIFTNFLYLSMV